MIRGYIGDRDAPPVFDAGSPFDVLGGGYQRPFELASLRLLNMAGILPRCAARATVVLRLLLLDYCCLVTTSVVLAAADRPLLLYLLLLLPLLLPRM